MKNKTIENRKLKETQQVETQNFASLPKGWKIKKLGEVCVIELGKTPYRKNEAYWDKEKLTNNVWLSISDLLNTKDKYVYDSKEYISDKGAEISKIVRKGTLLLSFKLTVGRLAFAGRDLFTNEAIAALTIQDEEKVNKEYLYYYLLFFDWDKATEGESKVKGKTLNKTKLKELDIIIPPLPEQKRIVAILDRAFEAIDKAKNIAQQNLNNAKELFQSKMQRIFDSGKLKVESGEWEEKKLGEVCETGSGGTPLKTHKEYYEGGHIPWLRSGEICKKNITKCEMYITNEGLKNSSAKLFPKNTVLIAMYGATAGQVGILRFESTTNQAVCGILPNNKIIPEFIYYKFLEGKKKLVKQAVGGAQPNISQIKIKNTKIPIPPLAEQKRIVAQLDALQTETKKLEEIYQKKIANLEELKKSILQKAFRGEL